MSQRAKTGNAARVCQRRSAALAGIIGGLRAWIVLMISALSIPCRDGGDAEVGVTELALDDVERHTLSRRLDRVGVPELMLVPTSAQASLCRPDVMPILTRKSAHVGMLWC